MMDTRRFTVLPVSSSGLSPLENTVFTTAADNVSTPNPPVASLDNVSISGQVTIPDGCIEFPFSTFAPWNNPNDLVSLETRQFFKQFVDVYMLTLFFFISVPSNIVNMIVFWRHGIRERINLCLFFVSFADFIVVFGHFEWKLDRLYSAITNTPYKLFVAKYNINNMIHSLAGFIYISGFMSTLIAFERCLCVVSPLRAQRIIQTRTTAAIIFLGHAVIFAGHYIIATKWKVVCMFDPLIQHSIDAIYSSQFYLKNKPLIDVFEGVIFGILLPGCFVAGVSISTVVIIIKVRKMAQWREQSTSASSAGGSAAKDLNLTRMLIGTNVLFIVCNTPPLIFHASLPFLPELSLTGSYYNTYYLFIDLQMLLACANSSCNFFVYYVFGSKFRATVQGLLCRRCQHGEAKRVDADRSATMSTTTPGK